MIRSMELINFESDDIFKEQLSDALNKKNEVVLEKNSSKYNCLKTDFYENKHEDLKKMLYKWQNSFENIVVVGTGGSNLGSQAIISANLQNESSPIPIYLDNLNSNYLKKIIDKISPHKTGFIIISKSGNTIEVISQFLVLLEMVEGVLGEEKSKTHFIVITSNNDSALRKISVRKKMIIVDHDAHISGRFSVLSCVGWVPALAVGVDFEKILNGAMNVYNNLANNSSLPVSGSAFMSTLNKQNTSINVMATYDPRLKTFCDWHRQLWSESLAKNNSGMISTTSLMPVDQHSQLQAWLDGPKDKIINIIKNIENKDDIKINASLIEEINFLDNKSINDVLDATFKSTMKVLNESGRPARLILVNEIDGHTIGELLMHFMLETIITSSLLMVDPFDQPAIEEVKKLSKEFI